MKKEENGEVICRSYDEHCFGFVTLASQIPEVPFKPLGLIQSRVLRRSEFRETLPVSLKVVNAAFKAVFTTELVQRQKCSFSHKKLIQLLFSSAAIRKKTAHKDPEMCGGRIEFNILAPLVHLNYFLH